MRHLILGLVLVSLLAAPTVAQLAPAGPFASVLAVLVDGNPNAGGRILAITPLEAPASADLSAATYVTLRIGTRRFVFAIGRAAPVGSPVGASLVRLRSGNRTLSEAAVLLSAALTGKIALALLTEGTLDAGVVTAIVSLDPGGGLARVATEGATQATIFRDGQETTMAIGPGRTGPTLVLDGSEGESKCRHCDGMGGMP